MNKLENQIMQTPKSVEALHSKPMNFSGTAAYNLGNNKFVSGITYYVDGKEYLEVAEGSHIGKVLDVNSLSFLDDEKNVTVINAIKNINDDNEAIYQARIQRAKEIAGDDNILIGILLANMDYQNGDVNENPIEKNGIKLYQIGHNASHHFCIGTKDGKRYRLAYESLEDLDDIQIQEVATFEGGYYGHY